MDHCSFVSSLVRKLSCVAQERDSRWDLNLGGPDTNPSFDQLKIFTLALCYDVFETQFYVRTQSLLQSLIQFEPKTPHSV